MGGGCNHLVCGLRIGHAVDTLWSVFFPFTEVTYTDAGADTGASDTMMADQAFVDNFWVQVSGAIKYDGHWIYPCNSWIPNMHINIGPGHSHDILARRSMLVLLLKVSAPRAQKHPAGMICWLIIPTAGVCRGALQGTAELANAAAPFFLTFFGGFQSSGAFNKFCEPSLRESVWDPAYA